MTYSEVRENWDTVRKMLGLRTRAMNGLLNTWGRMQSLDLDDVLKLNRAEFMRTQNLGAKAVNEIEAASLRYLDGGRISSI